MYHVHLCGTVSSGVLKLQATVERVPGVKQKATLPDSLHAVAADMCASRCNLLKYCAKDANDIASDRSHDQDPVGGVERSRGPSRGRRLASSPEWPPWDAGPPAFVQIARAEQQVVWRHPPIVGLKETGICSKTGQGMQFQIYMYDSVGDGARCCLLILLRRAIPRPRTRRATHVWDEGIIVDLSMLRESHSFYHRGKQKLVAVTSPSWPSHKLNHV